MLIINKGEVFGRLKVIKEIDPDISPSGYKFRKFKFKCVCGNTPKIRLVSVTTGRTKSCGCYNKEIMTKHGLAKHKLYKTWCHMHDRCENINNVYYKDYGGRGIKVCKTWQGREGLLNFIEWSKLNGQKKGLQLDRRDNDKGYSPKNCRYVTSSVNGRNRRITYYVKHPVTEQKVTLRDLVDEMALPELTYEVVYFRIEKCGYPLLKALTKPYKFKRTKNK